MKKGHWYIAATAVLFSTAEITSKAVAGRVNPLQLVFLRFLLGGLFLLPFALADIRRRGLRLNLNDWLFFALNGFIGVVASMSVYQLSLVYAKASSVAVLFSVNTVFTALFAVLILRERFTWGTAAALVLSLMGVACMLLPAISGAGLPGYALALLAAALFALNGVITMRRVEKYKGFVLNSFSFLIGVVMMLPVMAAVRAPVFTGLNLADLPYVLYYGVAVTGLGYYFYLTAMRETSAIETSAVFFIKPALAPLLALLFLGEGIGWAMAAGIALITAAAFVLFRARALAGRAGIRQSQ